MSNLYRYIEVFRTTRSDIKAVVNKWSNYVRPSPYGTRGRGGGGSARGPRRQDFDYWIIIIILWFIRGGRGPRGDMHDQGYYQQYQPLPPSDRYGSQGYYDNSYQSQQGSSQMVSYPPPIRSESGEREKSRTCLQSYHMTGSLLLIKGQQLLLSANDVTMLLQPC